MDGRSPRSKGTRVGLRLAVAAAAVVAAAGTLSTVGVGGIGPDLIGVVGVLCYTFVGAIILDRRPGEPVGRICLGIGLLYGVAATLRLVAVFGDGLGGRLPPAFRRGRGAELVLRHAGARAQWAAAHQQVP